MPRGLTLAVVLVLVLYFLLIFVLPVAQAFWYSLNIYDIQTGHSRFVGLRHYGRLFGDPQFWTGLRVAFGFTASVLAVGLVLWGKDALFLFVLASTMVSFSMLLIPLYLMFVNVGLDNSYIGVVLPTAISAYGIFLCRQFIRGIPRDLFDAAMIDGASDLRVYLGLVLPLARPVLAALAIFTLIGSLNSLLWPLVVLADTELYTLPLALSSYIRQGESIIFTQILAAAVLGSLPLVVAFLVLQRNFIKGISLTGQGGH